MALASRAGASFLLSPQSPPKENNDMQKTPKIGPWLNKAHDLVAGPVSLPYTIQNRSKVWPEKIGPSQGKQTGRSFVGQQPWIRKQRPSCVAVLAMVCHVSYSGFMVQSGEFARHEQLKTSYPFRCSVGHQNWPLPSLWGKKCGGNVGLAPSVHS